MIFPLKMKENRVWRLYYGGKLIDKMKLENLTPNIDVSKIEIKEYDLNRPALQLSGFFEYFDKQVIK